MNQDSLRILVIDDESTIREMLRTNLKHQFQVYDAATGQAGLALATDSHPHLVILDLGLPDMTGLEVLKALRRWTTVPVIVLTVSDDENMKVALLDNGADDYMTKPFGIPELTARIRVSLRRHQYQEATPIFESGDLRIDLNQRMVSRSDRVVKMTATEFELLARLVREKGKVVPQAKLLKEIWGSVGSEQTHYLRLYIGYLRKKLEKDSAHPKHILTEPGVGYRLV